MDKMQRKPEKGDVGKQFSRSVARDQSLKVQANIKLFLDRLRRYPDEGSVNTPEAAADIKVKFKEFLLANEFHMALRDFNALLEELGDKPREDGTIAWYHQLGPILSVLSFIEDGTLSMESINKYGGLEILIRTGLRHDSIEDFGKSFKDFKQKQIQNINNCYRSLKNKGITVGDNWIAHEKSQLDILMSNLKLMTKKIAELDKNGKIQYHPDGRMKKISVFEHIREGARTRFYINNMLHSEEASPFVWLLKIGDGTNNLATMLGSKKFTPKRRLKYCNEREDMFGSRLGVTEQAIQKWPEFANAIKKMDAMMGAVLYTNFWYLEHVDEKDAYPDDDSKFRDGDEILQVGIGKYMAKTLSIKTPPAFNDFSKLLGRIKDRTIENDSEIKKQRTIAFVEEGLKPTLEKRRNSFPIFFPKISAQNRDTPRNNM